MQQNEIKSKCRRISFTVDEDRFITAGIKKHGFGRWTAILKDPDYNFFVIRTCDSIMKRARTLVSRLKRTKQLHYKSTQINESDI